MTTREKIIAAAKRNAGIETECWIKRDGLDTQWEHWCVTFDGCTAAGYNNGVEVKKA